MPIMPNQKSLGAAVHLRHKPHHRWEGWVTLNAKIVVPQNPKNKLVIGRTQDLYESINFYTKKYFIFDSFVSNFGLLDLNFGLKLYLLDLILLIKNTKRFVWPLYHTSVLHLSKAEDSKISISCYGLSHCTAFNNAVWL